MYIEYDICYIFMFIKSSPLDCEMISFAHVLSHHFQLCLHACIPAVYEAYLWV